MRYFTGAALAVAAMIGMSGVAISDTTVDRESRGSMKTNLGSGIAVNKNSTLKREWIVVNSSDMPVRLGMTGAKTIYAGKKCGNYGSSYRDKDYCFRAEWTMEVKQPLVAIEVTFLRFDIWGEQQRGLRSTDIMDMSPGEYKMSGIWNARESDVREHYASIAYVEKVRTEDGRILSMPPQAIVQVAQEFQEDFSEEDLELDED